MEFRLIGGSHLIEFNITIHSYTRENMKYTGSIYTRIIAVQNKLVNT